MLNKILLSLVCTCFLLIIGCGQDGDDGDAFISFNWNTTPEWYWDDNPSIPNTITRNRNYKTGTGNYDFSYEIYDSQWYAYWTYTGTYKITINQGEKGSFLLDGEDGDDKYFSLFLGVDGPRTRLSKIILDLESENTLKKATTREPEQIESFRTTKNQFSFKKELNVGNLKIEIYYNKIKR